jgi:hypothetical protein
MLSTLRIIAEDVPYDAPYFYYDPKSLITPESYIILLRADYTLEEHSNAIGTNIEPYIIYLPDRFHDGGLFYGCEGVKDEHFTNIRAYRGVSVIKPNHRPFPIDHL